jgi:nitrate reductase NapE component
MKILSFMYRFLVFTGILLLSNFLFLNHGVWDYVAVACISGVGMIFAVFSWTFIEKFFANSQTQSK